MIRADVPYFTADGRLTKAGFDVFAAMEREVLTLRAKVAAAAAVADATGGTADVEARAELVAIKAALA